MKKTIQQFKKNLQDEFSVDPELEFLPAALEVQKTPPLPMSRIVLWLIVLFFIIAVIWASFGKVDIVAVATGKIIPSGQVKIIQPLADSAIKQIYVREGQRVKKGDALIELDNTSNQADQNSLYNERHSAQTNRVRLHNLLSSLKQQSDSQQTIASMQTLACENPNDCILDSLDKAAKETLHYQIQTQWRQYQAQLSSYQKQIEEQQAERKATQDSIAQLNATIPLISERANSIKQLLQTQAISRTEWLSIEEQRIQQVKQRDIARNNIHKVDAAIDSLKQQRYAFIANTENEWISERNELSKQTLNLDQEIIKNQNRTGLQTITAPVDGTVQQLATHTVGGVVTTAQELMRIVPQADALQVQAFVQNKDIGFVEAGQDVSIKIDTFPFTKYGFIQGSIKTLSNDAVEHEQLGLVYAAQLDMNKSTMQVNNKTVNLSPGMSVTAEVNLGKRRIIEYILTPLLKYKSESIRER